MMGPAHRVLLVCGPAVGGMRRHLEALTVGLPKRGFEPAVTAPAMLTLATPVPRFEIQLGDRPRPASDLGALVGLRRAVREWRPALVHAHGVKAALLALGSPLPGRPPVVLTFHNQWRGGPLTLPLRLVTHRAAVVIAVSEAVRAGLTSHRIHPPAIEVIPNGLDLSRFSGAPRHPTGQPFTAAFLGRLTREKGVPVLLEAVRAIPDSSAVRFVVAGDGPLRAAVEAEASRTGSPLEYRGQQAEVLAIYHDADTVLVPSLSEGHPLTALEAMACMLPVIASRAGGLPEIVVDGETGVLVPSGDAAALVDALKALAENPDRARTLGEAGRRRVESAFSVERMLERVAAVYRRALGDEVEHGYEQP
jgi:glycosyltransferase involved in cell wall biosynthesis